jgi:hypothetical protein
MAAWAEEKPAYEVATSTRTFSTKVLLDEDSAEFVGFPPIEAEYLLDLEMNKMPAAKNTIRLQDQYLRLKNLRIDLLSQMVVEKEKQRAEWERMTEAWKAAAKASETSFFEDALPYIIGGLVGGAVSGGAVAIWLAGKE